MVSVSVSVEGLVGLTWPLWDRLVRRAEELGFDAVYLSDHFTMPSPSDLESLELIVALTHAVEHTNRVMLGPLVSPLSFRHPVVLTRQVMALDELSRGRMVLGLGAGHVEREYGIFGFDLGDVDTQFARLREGLEVATRLLRNESPVTFSGRFYTLRRLSYYPLADGGVTADPYRRKGPQSHASPRG